MNLKLQEKLKQQPNPFSSNRVDTPFQQHPDLKQVYSSEFEVLKSTILNIKNDSNNQSQGAAIVGEPGSGKAHLIMRLAQELLTKNRLLFIRQPNNPDSILFHIYSRILESFAEKVPGSKFNQFEYLLANSFVNLLRSFQERLSRKGKELLENLEGDSLRIFQVLGGEKNTAAKRESWK